MRFDAARAALRTAARVAGPIARRLLPERLLLAGIWRAYPAEALDRYLVAGYQNPRINLQSVLMRHALIRALFGTRPWLEALMVEEIRFAIELNDVVRRRAAELGVDDGLLSRRLAL
jgi:hypothetical protein